MAVKPSIDDDDARERHQRRKMERHAENYALSSIVEFSVQLVKPAGATTADCRRYVWDAVTSWCGSFESDEPLFALNRDSVTVLTVEPPSKQRDEIRKAIQDAVDEDRAKTFLVGLIGAVVIGVIGFAAGIYFATHLYGGS